VNSLAVLGIALAAWVIVGSLTEFALRLTPAHAGGLDLAPTRLWQRAAGLPRAAYGMLLAHIGLGVFVAGVVSSSAWQSESIVRLQVGDTAKVAGYRFELTGVGEEVGPNFVARQARLEVTRRGHPVATLTPARRFYPVEGQATTEAAIDSGVFRDLYAVLSENEPTDGAWAFRIYHNPLVLWIFGGVGLMALGGLVSLSDRRLRVGAPRPARRAAPAAAPSAA
jgi:cytochrome c-type biogenesis protein CcmF